MRKYNCSGCYHKCPITQDEHSDFFPINCLYFKEKTAFWTEIKEEKEAVTDCDQLPKLTAKALPDWCKVGKHGYDNEQQRYFEIVNIDEKFVDIEYLNDGIGATCDYSDMQKCSEAKKRPFNEKEMQGFVGKLLRHHGFTELVFTYNEQDKTISTMCCISKNADWLMDYADTVDGKPCYVLEHLENGEWME